MVIPTKEELKKKFFEKTGLCDAYQEAFATPLHELWAELKRIDDLYKDKEI